MSHSTIALSVAALASLCSAQQHPSCAGNGIGQAYLSHGQARIGGTLQITMGSPASPNGVGVLSVSDGFGPVVFPTPALGTICLDVFSAGYFTELVFFDATGNIDLQFPIPNVASQAGLPTLYINALAVEGTQRPRLAVSHTSPLRWHNGDGYRPTGSMQLARSMHQATSLSRYPTDTRVQVLITGGGGGNFMQPAPTASTEIYEPLLGSFIAGPTMNDARAEHRAVLLQDGRVLVTGGAGLGGVGLSSCEIYDPVQNTFIATSPMNAPRMGHGCTLLPDGRVFVSGGFSTFQNAITQFGTVLSSAQDSSEVYDPNTDQWTAMPPMASQRAGHGQILMPNGQVLIMAGIRGYTLAGGLGPAVPTYTTSCEVFDPATNTLAGLPNMNVVRAFFGYSIVPGGLLVTGGIVPNAGFYGAAEAGAVCEFFDGIAWTNVGNLPSTQAFHKQITSPTTGRAISIGGFTGDLTTLAGTSATAEHDTVTASAANPIGTEPFLGGSPVALGHHTVTELYDGTFLVVGGASALVASAQAWIYVPN